MIIGAALCTEVEEHLGFTKAKVKISNSRNGAIPVTLSRVTTAKSISQFLVIEAWNFYHQKQFIKIPKCFVSSFTADLPSPHLSLNFLVATF